MASALFVLVGLGLIGWGLYNVQYAAGWSGVPGQFRAVDCRRHHSAHHHTSWSCDGVFFSDDGHVRDENAGISQHEPIGDPVRVRRTAAGGYVATGTGQVIGNSIPAVAGLAVLAFGVHRVVTGLRLRARARGDAPAAG